MRANALFFQVSDTRADIGFAITDALRGRMQLETVLRASISKALAGEELAVANATMDLFRSASKRRDALAHHLWGLSSQVPDGLLAIEAELYFNTMIAHDRATREGRIVTAAEVRFDPERIQVYRRADFEEALLAQEHAFAAIAGMTTLLMQNGDDRRETCRRMRESHILRHWLR